MNFRPTKVTIRKLKLDKYLLSRTFVLRDFILFLDSSQEVMETILDFSCFLLRYFENIDYDDFSDLSIINSKIRRAEIHRIWIDTEDILGRLEANETSIKQNLVIIILQPISYRIKLHQLLGKYLPTLIR
jgi:hypothetical protein